MSLLTGLPDVLQKALFSQSTHCDPGPLVLSLLVVSNALGTVCYSRVANIIHRIQGDRQRTMSSVINEIKF